jgi:DNA-binding IclR family transcriptional regulator
MSPAGRDPGLTGRQPGAVHGALSVLEEVARVGPGVTAQQISTGLGLPRATTYRLLNLLVQDEYLVRMPDLAGFALGRKVALLADLAAQPAAPDEPHDILVELRRRIRGGVHLASYREGVLELLDVDPDFPLSDERRILSDLSASALGGLLLAERRGAPVPYVAVADGPVPGRGCFAAAIRDPQGSLVAGLALALPSPRLGDPEALLQLIEADRPRLAAALR